jgi:hypothetical protein
MHAASYEHGTTTRNVGAGSDANGESVSLQEEPLKCAGFDRGTGGIPLHKFRECQVLANRR